MILSIYTSNFGHMWKGPCEALGEQSLEMDLSGVGGKQTIRGGAEGA